MTIMFLTPPEPAVTNPKLRQFLADKKQGTGVWSEDWGGRLRQLPAHYTNTSAQKQPKLPFAEQSPGRPDID